MILKDRVVRYPELHKKIPGVRVSRFHVSPLSLRRECVAVCPLKEGSIPRLNASRCDDDQSRRAHYQYQKIWLLSCLVFESSIAQGDSPWVEVSRYVGLPFSVSPTEAGKIVKNFGNKFILKRWE